VTTITTFNSDWYANMIEAQLTKCADAGPDALAIARGLMVAGAFVAEAIESASEEISAQLSDLGGATDRVAEQLDELGVAVGSAGQGITAGLYDLPGPDVAPAAPATR
jgi:hypothetical protein